MPHHPVGEDILRTKWGPDRAMNSKIGLWASRRKGSQQVATLDMCQWFVNKEDGKRSKQGNHLQVTQMNEELSSQPNSMCTS
eukprot:5561457-Amphidinium_carterae.1